MKNITVFLASSRKKATYQAALEIEKNLKSYGEANFEIVFLKDYHLEFCRGCKQCFDKGEGFCPIQDDRNLLIDKIKNSDGVIFATPNYSFQISAIMKNFFDRISFFLHRPSFFGKTYTYIVTQGIIGGGSIAKYLDYMGNNLGFKVTKGCVLNTLESPTDKVNKKNIQKIKKVSKNFYKELMNPSLKAPSIGRLMIFRITRTNIKLSLNDENYDYRYFKEKGWFESNYYYNTSLGPIKKIIGHLIDFLGRNMFKNT